MHIWELMPDGGLRSSHFLIFFAFFGIFSGGWGIYHYERKSAMKAINSWNLRRGVFRNSVDKAGQKRIIIVAFGWCAEGGMQ
jgi:hypothetical protein